MDLKPILTRLNIDYAAVYQQLPTLMSGVFVVALSSTAANMVWTFVPVDERPVPASVSSSSLSRSGPVENRQQSDLSSWHLFGLADMAPPKEVAQEIPDEAPDTSLRLTLKGVYASDDPSRAWAIVAGSSGDDEIYRVESSLPGGAIL
ncbi:MAG: hypothetical protein OEX00_09245, partial [Gammaproteobacteria bacterium]|nr:hypothetical protein [Gammaproteobacteria bacterium]